jgi:dihydrofolate synthase/folylpolyglutamate synthase
MEYDEALTWLEGRYNLEQKLGGADVPPPTLDRMRALVEMMGDPQDAAPVIHLTGTNGKGSTSRMISELLLAHGLDVGGYSSPHIDKVNDRITRGNQRLTDDEFAEAISLVAAIEPLARNDAGPINYFEAVCAAAYGWFAANAISVMVVEVGLGGTWDATNVANADVAVVTNVAMDHAEIIGPELTDIAREKSGIIQPDSHVILGVTDHDLTAVFRARESRDIWQQGVEYDLLDNRLAVGGRFFTVRTPGAVYEEVFSPIHGAHQGNNAAAAIAAVEAFFGRALDQKMVEDAFAQLSLPARFEILHRQPLVAVDGAHNPAGAETAAETLFSDFVAAEAPVLVLGCNRPHDPMELLTALRASEASAIVATAPDWPRAVDPALVAKAAESFGVPVETCPNVGDAIDRAIALAGEGGVVLVCGSLYVAGEARHHLG